MQSCSLNFCVSPLSYLYNLYFFIKYSFSAVCYATINMCVICKIYLYQISAIICTHIEFRDGQNQNQHKCHRLYIYSITKQPISGWIVYVLIHTSFLQHTKFMFIFFFKNLYASRFYNINFSALPINIVCVGSAKKSYKKIQNVQKIFAQI